MAMAKWHVYWLFSFSATVRLSVSQFSANDDCPCGIVFHRNLMCREFSAHMHLHRHAHYHLFFFIIWGTNKKIKLKYIGSFPHRENRNLTKLKFFSCSTTFSTGWSQYFGHLALATDYRWKKTLQRRDLGKTTRSLAKWRQIHTMNMMRLHP